MKYLIFAEPNLKEGLNMTVRQGDKWMEAELGEKLEVTEVDTGNFIHNVEVVGKMSIIFDLIPEEILKYGNSKESDKGSLTEWMKHCYPEFNTNETVTVLFFLPTVEEGEVAPIL